MRRTREPGERQKAKSLRMHAKLVRAVIECLERYGYAETSINRVLERAEVSRGALQHHFANKEELIAATAERLMNRSLEVMRAPETGKRRMLGSELRILWAELIHTREYRALLEILNAMRTDRKLRKRILPLLQSWNDRIDEHMIELYVGSSGVDVEIVEIMTMSRCLLRGLVIQENFSRDPALIENIIERWIALIAPVVQPRAAAAKVAS